MPELEPDTEPTHRFDWVRRSRGVRPTAIA